MLVYWVFLFKRNFQQGFKQGFKKRETICDDKLLKSLSDGKIILKIIRKNKDIFEKFILVNLVELAKKFNKIIMVSSGEKKA